VCVFYVLDEIAEALEGDSTAVELADIYEKHSHFQLSISHRRLDYAIFSLYLWYVCVIRSPKINQPKAGDQNYARDFGLLRPHNVSGETLLQEFFD
jgi:hypothetical protein